MRIELELSDEQNRKLEALMLETGLKTGKDLFNTALTLLEWAVHERRAGRIVASVDENGGTYKELVMPSGKRVATAEEFEKAKKHVFTKHRKLLKNLAKR